MQGFTSLVQENQNQMETVVEEQELESAAELEALSTNELLNYIIYHDTLIHPFPPPQITTLPSNDNKNIDDKTNIVLSEQPVNKVKRKRRRRAKVCKNKEEAETQRMTHIAVERNRRKQMNGHLSMLRSLMPDSYIQRGDQASIVGGAIEYVKELEHLLQTLESQKLLVHHHAATATPSSSATSSPFSQFFSHPQYTWTTNNNMSSNTINYTSIMNNYKFTAMSSSSSRSNDVADIEVSLIETHANVRILSRRCFSQLSKMVAAFHSLSLSILHLNVTTLDPLVLYSISAKVEEGCQLISADDIATAVHHMLRIIEEEATIC